MSQLFVVPPLGGIGPDEFRLKPVLQTVLADRQKRRALRPSRREGDNDTVAPPRLTDPLPFIGAHSQLFHLSVKVGSVQAHIGRRVGHVALRVVDLTLNKFHLELLRRIA